jgi:hypothetical protein
VFVETNILQHKKEIVTMSNEIIIPATAAPLTPEQILAEMERLKALMPNLENGASDNTPSSATDASQDTTDNNPTNHAADTSAATSANEVADNIDETSSGAQSASSPRYSGSQPDSTESDHASQAENSTLAAAAIPSLVPTASDPQHIINLKTAIAAALANPEYVKDIRRVEKSAESFKMPDEEARVKAQLKSHAERKLRADAAIEAERTGVYTAPSKAQIDAHIEKGLKAWRAKHKK